MNTVKHLRESKSSSDLYRSGFEIETRALAFLLTRKHQILFYRLRTRFAEVDIVSLDSKGVLHLIEVKSSEPIYFYESKQVQRLYRLQDCLLARDLDVELSICYPKDGKLVLYPLSP